MMSIPGMVAGDAPALQLLDTALRTTPIFLAAWLAVTVWRSASAASRHLVWLLALGLSLAVPLVRRSVAPWSVAVLPAAPAASPRLPQSRPPMDAMDNEVLLAPVRRLNTRQSNDPASSERTSTTQAATTAQSRIDSSSPASASAPEVPGLAFWLWSFGVLAVLLPWIAGLGARYRLARGATRALSSAWTDAVDGLRAEGVKLDRVRLLQSPTAPVPMTWGLFHPSVMVPTAPDWSPAFRRAALLHELAHVRRKDVLGFVVARVACAAYWFNPLAWIAAHAIRRESELACDDRVLSAGARASDYARQLMQVANEMGFAPPSAALAMARPATLPVRLRALLDHTRNRNGARPAIAGGFIIARLLLVIPVAAFTPVHAAVAAVEQGAPEDHSPARAVDSSTSTSSVALRVADTSHATAGAISVPAAGRQPAVTPAMAAETPDIVALTPRSSATPLGPSARLVMPGMAPGAAQQADVCLNQRPGSSHNSSNMTESDGGRRTWRVRWSSGDCRFDLDASGDIKLNDDASDVRSITSGGWFELEIRNGASSRRVRLTPRSGGGLDREYFEDGRRADYDRGAEAWFSEAWFSEALIALDRRTAFAVDQRLPLLIRRGGVNGAMEEIRRMYSDYVKRVYYGKLLETQTLTTSQVRQVLADVGREFTSDYEKAELLVTLAKGNGFDTDAQLEFARASGTIKSDYERRRALSALLGRDRLPASVVTALLEAAQGMESDYELAELLIAVATRYAVDESTRPFYVKALNTISSDYERRRVLTASLSSDNLPREVLQDLLVVAESMKSDYERAEFLIGLVSRSQLDASNYDSFFRAVAKISSDYEHHRVLSAALKNKKLDRTLVEGVLRSARGIESDYECASLLVEVASAFPIDDRLRPAFEDTADTIKGEYEYGRAMAALRKRG